MRLNTSLLYVLKQDFDGHIKGSLFLIVRRNPVSNQLIFNRFTNDNSIVGEQLTINFVNVDELFTICDYTSSEFNRGEVKLIRSYIDDNKYEYLVIENNCNKKVLTPLELKVSLDTIKSIYKYIPLNISKNTAYYKDGKIYQISPKIQRNKSIKNELFISDFEEKNVLRYFSNKLAIDNFKFKVIDYKKSGKLFGFSGIKKEMIGAKFKASKIEYQVDVKKSQVRENTITLISNGRNIRFSIDDVKIIYPNISGWKLKKDKSLIYGSIVKVIRNKDFRFIKNGSEAIVNDFKKIGNKNYAVIEVEGKKVYSSLKNLKLIKK